MTTEDQKMTLQDALNDPTTEGALVEHSQVQLLSDAEINRQITTAKAYPRAISTFRKKTLELVTLSESVATECIYALPRAGKTIEGPSVRFAEILQSTWGNMRTGARVVAEDQSFIVAQAAFHDLETNAAMTLEIRRRITDKHGRRYNEDMVGVAGAAACSIALRNVILRGIPKALWHDAYVKAREVVAGDYKTLPNRRENALKAFVIYGVTPEQIYALLGVKGKDDMGIDHMVTLAGLLNSLKDGSAKPEDVFEAAVAAKRPTKDGVKGEEDLPTAKKPRKPKPPKEPVTDAQPQTQGDPPVEKGNDTGDDDQPPADATGDQPPSPILEGFLKELAEAGSIQAIDGIKGRAKGELGKEEYAAFMNAFLARQRQF